MALRGARAGLRRRITDRIGSRVTIIAHGRPGLTSLRRAGTAPWRPAGFRSGLVVTLRLRHFYKVPLHVPRYERRLRKDSEPAVTRTARYWCREQRPGPPTVGFPSRVGPGSTCQ